MAKNWTNTYRRKLGARIGDDLQIFDVGSAYLIKNSNIKEGFLQSIDGKYEKSDEMTIVRNGDVSPEGSVVVGGNGQFFRFEYPDGHYDIADGGRRKLLFWDIETRTSDGSDEFPDSSKDPIFMISMFYVNEITGESKGYLLSTIKHGYVNEGVSVEHYPDEKMMIERFFALIAELYPHFFVQYNGFGYDIPYVLNRCIELGIEMLPKIHNTYEYKPAVSEFARSVYWYINGIEQIDLMLYFKTIYPIFSSYKLENIGQFFLGKGKSGLHIYEMMEFLRTGDAEGLKQVAKYSMQDSFLLYDLCKKCDIIKNLCVTANGLYTTIEELLDEKPGVSVWNAIGLYNPDYLNTEGLNMKYTNSYKIGLYQNVSIVDRRDGYVALLGGFLKDLPTIYLYELCVKLHKDVRHDIDRNRIASLSTVYYIKDSAAENPIKKYDAVVITSTSGSLVAISGNNIEFDGRGEICKPPFKLAEDFARRIIMNYIRDRNSKNDEIEFNQSDFTGENLTESIKIDGAKLSDTVERYKSISRLANDDRLSKEDRETYRVEAEEYLNKLSDDEKLMYSLAFQYNRLGNISTWVRLNYVMSEGMNPILIKNWKDGVNSVDFNYYLYKLIKYREIVEKELR